MRGIDVSHSDSVIQARRKRAASHFADALAVMENGVVRPRRRSFLLHSKRHELFAVADFFCLQQCVVPDEIWLCQIDKESESGLDWISVRGQIRTIKRIAHFQAQRVARAESARFNSKRFALLERSVPKFHCVHCAKENFNAVLAGVTRARDGNLCFVEWKIDDRISQRELDIFAEQGVK